MRYILALAAITLIAAPVSARNKCPVPQKVTKLTKTIAVTRTLKKSRTLLALRDTSEKAQLTVQLINAAGVFKPGTYKIASNGSIPGLCKHNRCVELKVSHKGRNYALTATAGTLTLESTQGKLTGRLKDANFFTTMIVPRLSCDRITYDVSFDVPIVDKRTKTPESRPAESQPAESQPAKR